MSWLKTVTTLATAQIVAKLLVEWIMPAVQGGHPNYLEHRDEYLRQLSSEYDIPLKDLKKVAGNIENKSASWVTVARKKQSQEED